MSASETIKKLRLSLCLEQKEFADMLGIHVSSLSHYETSKRCPRLPIIRRLIEIGKKNKMKIEIDDFLT